MNKTIIIIPSFIIGLIFVWIILVYLPISKGKDELKKQLTTLEEKERNNISETKVNEMKNLVDSLGMSIDEGMKHIYSEERLLDLGKAVDSIGKQYDLQLLSIAPVYDSLALLIKETSLLSELPMLIEFKGGFNHFTQFLDGIPEFPFVLRINEVLIEKKDQESSDLNILLRGVIVLKKERMDEGEKEIEQVIKPGLT